MLLTIRAPRLILLVFERALHEADVTACRFDGLAHLRTEALDDVPHDLPIRHIQRQHRVNIAIGRRQRGGPARHVFARPEDMKAHGPFGLHGPLANLVQPIHHFQINIEQRCRPLPALVFQHPEVCAENGSGGAIVLYQFAVTGEDQHAMTERIEDGLRIKW